MKPNRLAFIQQHFDFRVDVPEGSHLIHEIKHQTITERDCKIANTVALVLRSDRVLYPGTYTYLGELGKYGNPYDILTWMSDHQCEVADHQELIEYAQENAPLDHVLINGLGLGVAIELLVPYVKHITVVEISPSVIKLVAKHYMDKYPDQLEIVRGNAFEFRPPRGRRYNAIFHDIWPSISRSNVAEMVTLHRRYAHWCDWQRSWARSYCERDLRKFKRHPEKYENEFGVRDVMRAAESLLTLGETLT
jgi:hypothetical protein